MKGLTGLLGVIAVGTTLLPLTTAPVSAESPEDPLVAQAGAIMKAYAERGTWANPMQAAMRSEGGSQSADQVMAAVLLGYSRALLDRGGWLNPYAPTRHYDAGTPLLAKAVGDGVTTTR